MDTNTNVDNDLEKIVLQLDDSRRLTGKNFFMNEPGAVLDAFVSGIDKQQVVETWAEQLAPYLSAVGWSDAKRIYRIFEDGISVGFAAPDDALYTATEINEAAWQRCCELLAPSSSEEDQSETAINTNIDELKTALDNEVCPHLLSLLTAADSHAVPYLVDDEFLTLGYGEHSQSWDIDALPELADLDWTAYQALPTVFITGTNGKSTSVRLTAQILKKAGLRCGVTSTDFIKVGDELIDKGDYSGPGGARMLLRHPKTEAAILEVARGGLLRRGLPIPRVNAALVTNVAEDHLGQYGINTVAALTAAKMMVAKAADRLILNAGDANIVDFVNRSLAESADASSESTIDTTKADSLCRIAQEPTDTHLPPITWFALSENNTVLAEARANNQPVCFVRDDQIIFANNNSEASEQVIIDIKDIPMTMAGAAVHNINNALGAVAVAKTLGLENAPIREALSEFASNAIDNPGRGNMFEHKGAKVILDFAHNAHSMDAMVQTLQNIIAKRKIILLCHAGDRSDAAVTTMTESIMAMKPDLVWICELPDYLRGREIGELPRVITKAVTAAGTTESAIRYAGSPLEGAVAIESQLQQGDLVFMMALSQRDAIAELLQ